MFFSISVQELSSVGRWSVGAAGCQTPAWCQAGPCWHPLQHSLPHPGPLHHAVATKPWLCVYAHALVPPSLTPDSCTMLSPLSRLYTHDPAPLSLSLTPDSCTTPSPPMVVCLHSYTHAPAPPWITPTSPHTSPCSSETVATLRQTQLSGNMDHRVHSSFLTICLFGFCN